MMMRDMDSKKSSIQLTRTTCTSDVDLVCNVVDIMLSSHEPLDGHRENDGNVAASRIKDDLIGMLAVVNQLDRQRRQVLNELLHLKGNICVLCRVRPNMEIGKFLHPEPVVAVDSNCLLINYTEAKSKVFTFDKVFAPSSTQDDVFLEVEPVLKSALDGYNACIFAYGQTGTGKTFTMEGTSNFPGIVPRSIEALFKQAADSNQKFIFTFSMLEIYMGHLKDLLIPRTGKATGPLPPCLSIQTCPNGGIEIENLVTINVNDFNHAMKLYTLGRSFRSTGSTNANKTSSRSHCMIRISISCLDTYQRRRSVNKLWLVDLGGSERVLKTKAQGRRFDEGKAINLSISALGDVIHALQTKMCHIPYRNSKLTQVLQDSLGEDSKVLMLVHVSPREEDLCETISSLNFATRVKTIRLSNKESLEARLQKEVAIRNLQQKMKQVEDKRNELRGNIIKLNRQLEKLTGISQLPNEEHESSCLLAHEDPRSRTKTRKPDVSTSSSSNVPRFMKPTICSRRKSGTCQQILKGPKSSPPARKRKPPLQRAESVSFPIDCRSGYISESSSISRTSCLVNLQTRFDADNQTELSQDTSDYDMRMGIFAEDEESPKILNFPKQNHEDSNTNEFDLHNGDQNLTSLAYWNRSVQAIRIPDERNSREEQKIVENFHDETVHRMKTVDYIVVTPDPCGVPDPIQSRNVTCHGNDLRLRMAPQFLQKDQSINGKETINLSTDTSYRMDQITPDSEATVHNPGLCDHLKNRLQILCTSILVGLGIWSLGFEHDFFFALAL